MAKPTGGTSVQGYVCPMDTTDTYPAHSEEWGRGGYRSVAIIEERDAIPMERRKIVIKYIFITIFLLLQFNLFSNDNALMNPLRFDSDIKVQLKDGKSFGKYKNGDIIPAKGKTALEVIKDALSENSTENVKMRQDDILITSIPNGIKIKTIKSISVSIFNLSGQRVYQSMVDGNTEIRLDKGLYIVRVNNKNQKVIVK